MNCRWSWRKAEQANTPLTPDELAEARKFREEEIWVAAGRPAAPVPVPDGFPQLKPTDYYRVKRADNVFVYRTDVTANTTEALGFLKDWVTSIIQLEIGALAAFGVAAGFAGIFASSEPAHQNGGAAAAVPVFAKYFASCELVLIVLSGICFFCSIRRGLELLNALPGAAQRLPASAAARRSDIYTIRNGEYHRSIVEMVDPFRLFFILGMGFFAAFVLVRLLEQLLSLWDVVVLARLLEQIWSWAV